MLKMGTNYYAKINCCKLCGKPEKEVHIGKDSAGWKFVIELNSEYFTNLEELYAFMQQSNVRIFDEYGKEVTYEDIIDIIETNKDMESRNGTDDKVDFEAEWFC